MLGPQNARADTKYGIGKSSSFLKKRTKKLLILKGGSAQQEARETFLLERRWAQYNFFFSKELLPSRLFFCLNLGCDGH
jgi:hypothetical protein